MARPREDDQLNARLAAVAVLGFVLLVPPIVTVFDGGGQFFSAPLIWVYLFVVWAAIIGAVALLVSRSG